MHQMVSFIDRPDIKELIVKNIKNIVKNIGQSDYLSLNNTVVFILKQSDTTINLACSGSRTHNVNGVMNVIK